MELLQQLAALLSRMTFFVMVSPWEQGLRVRLGKRVLKLGPGWHFKIPLLDQVFVQNTRVRTCVMPVQTITCADGRTVSVSGAVGYAITDLELLFRTLHSPDSYMESLVQSIVAAVFSKEMKSGRQAGIEIEAELHRCLKGTGLLVGFMRITDLAFVRTYRLISDTKWGDGRLDIDKRRA